MTGNEPRTEQAAELRRQAEEIARQQTAQSRERLETLSPEAARQALHELQVHQIELEMQNEELRRAQVELEASQSRYFELYDLAPVGYCTLSEQGLILQANLAAAGMLGVSRVGLVKQPITRFIFKEDQDLYYLRRKELVESGAPQACEIRMLCQDGTQFWAHLAATAGQGADGALVCRLVMSDITDRKKTELKMAEQARELARSNAELEQFASVVSHDLRSPLISLSGCSQLLIQETEGLSGEARELARHLRGSALRMGRLIDSLLRYSHVGRAELKWTRCSLEEVLSRVLRDVRTVQEASGGQVTHSPLPEVDADPALVAQLLQNLIENGMKYRDEVPSHIHISAHETPTECVISVADNGIGIDPKHFDKIFQIFQRLHEDESTYPGVGLGLAICKKIVECHGGGIWVESQPGRGSTFTFSLPRRGSL